MHSAFDWKAPGSKSAAKGRGSSDRHSILLRFLRQRLQIRSASSGVGGRDRGVPAAGHHHYNGSKGNNLRRLFYDDGTADCRRGLCCVFRPVVNAPICASTFHCVSQCPCARYHRLHTSVWASCWRQDTTVGCSMACARYPSPWPARSKDATRGLPLWALQDLVLWARRTIGGTPWLCLATLSHGKNLCLADVVARADPRRLVVRFEHADLKFMVVVLHTPCLY